MAPWLVGEATALAATSQQGSSPALPPTSIMPAPLPPTERRCAGVRTNQGASRSPWAVRSRACRLAHITSAACSRTTPSLVGETIVTGRRTFLLPRRSSRSPRASTELAACGPMEWWCAGAQPMAHFRLGSSRALATVAFKRVGFGRMLESSAGVAFCGLRKIRSEGRMLSAP